MPALSRRAFLGGTAATGLLAAGATSASSAVRRVPLTREDRRVVVIGSGFGGGVTALRFAQSGVPVLVLERGIRWPTGPNAETFPHPLSPDKRIFWMATKDYTAARAAVPFLPADIGPTTPYTGLLEAVVGDGMTQVCAAGVGGGSLVYQGMSLQPSEAVFNTHLPEALDYGRMNSEYFPRVRQMLQLQTAPDELIASPNYAAARIFAKNVKKAGMPLSKIPMPIDWTFALRELKGEMKPSYTNGDGALGVNNGGKHTVDVTYLAQAEATGLVEVAVQHNVTDVAMAKDGRWEVHVDRIATDGTVLEQKVITAKALVMSAGTANTTKLLMRAQHKGLISDLPDGLGTNWGSNGDRIYQWIDLADDFGSPQGGPVVYGSLDWSDPETANTVIQASMPPMPNLRMSTCVGYGATRDRGHFIYDAQTDGIRLQWPKGAGGDAKLHLAVQKRVDIIGGSGSAMIDTNVLTASTWHPLGGASMGSVCDLSGRVQGHRGLYVLDGSLLPGTSAACNPSMTIAAVTERATDDLLANDAGTVF